MILKGSNVLLAGASGAIGSSLYSSIESMGADILAISSKTGYDMQLDLTKEYSIEKLRGHLSYTFIPDVIICCSGILHNDDFLPEKKLADFSSEWFFKSAEMNIISHVNLAKAVDPLIEKNKSVIWVSLSAMVGSISDNKLGGWYTYRMTKAALNMFVRGLSIEWHRKAKDSAVVAIHPGTTDSQMSKPFSIRKDKLYSPQLTADRIISVIESLSAGDTGSFINWNGNEIEW